ncbi:alginate export family protein [Pseudomonas sp. KNUC1026]|uniref:alginate export family protein n=1 Tax=Pseudomonas sp. KNUC1026 TaxID=2893890 RepID=UPI001F3323E7|nr:alginate export family protein [Pseudomonas sp. KNUC1026]UFH50395.1 alginate export family protein [Pseudomonas sp. KNUC1026]
MRSPRHIPLLSLAALCSLASQAPAYTLYSEGEGSTVFNADLWAGYGAFGTQQNYIVSPDAPAGKMRWQEGFAKYGFSGHTDKLGAGSVYGAFNLISTGTWGDGDAGGITTGDERRTSVEDAFLGWKSGDLFPALGQDGVDFSMGRQLVTVGEGFLVTDDGFNPGKGFNPAEGMPAGHFDRGGAFYLGQRLAFGNTAVLKLGGSDGLHGSVLWLKSGNPGQSKTEVAGGTLDYTTAYGTVGATYLHGLDVDKRYAFADRLERKGMNVYSLRGQGNAGIENADFAIEFARQEKSSGSQRAMYFDAGYTFTDVAWQPTVSYRYSRYSEGWDFLFQGGFRKRFQGEVAANYAGSVTSNMSINDVLFSVKPTETLTLNAMAFDYHQMSRRSELDVSAREVDLFLDWAVTDNITLSPLLGFYKPDKWQGNGGLQSNNASTNTYFQFIVWATY